MPVVQPIDRAVVVTVTREDRFPTVAGFNTTLLLTPVALAGKLTASLRTRLYSNMVEVAVDWAGTSEPYKWAQKFFSARIRPPQLKMGYYDPTKPITDELDAIYAYDNGWFWGGHTNELNDSPKQRDIAAWAEARNVLFALDSNDTDTESPNAIEDVTKTATISNANPAVVMATAHGLSLNDPVRFTTSGTLPAPLDPTATYYAIPVAANTFQLATTPDGAALGTTAAGSGTHTVISPRFGGSIGEFIEGMGYDHSAAFYHTDPGMYLSAGAWAYTSGRDFDRANYREAAAGRIDSGQAYTLKFKTLPGMTALNKPSSTIQAITGFVPGLGSDRAQGHRANTYINVAGIDMLVEGTVGSGAFIDEIHATAWIIARVQESVLALLANNARVPYDNRGAGFLIEGGVNPPMRRAFAAGLIAPQYTDDGLFLPEFETSVDDIANIPVAQRRNRIAPDIKLRFRYAGAFHFVSVTATLRY